jgi:hypothetical protein
MNTLRAAGYEYIGVERVPCQLKFEEPDSLAIATDMLAKVGATSKVNLLHRQHTLRPWLQRYFESSPNSIQFDMVMLSAYPAAVVESLLEIVFGNVKKEV